MKIAYVIPSFPKRSETFISREVRYIHEESEHDIDVHTFNKNENVENPIPDRVHSLSRSDLKKLFTALIFCLSSPGRTWSLWLNTSVPIRKFLQGVFIAKHVRNTEADVIVHHYIDLTADSAIICSKLLDTPLVFSAHAKDIFLTKAEKLQKRIKQASSVVTCTEYNKNYLSEIAGDDEKIHTSYHCLDPDTFSGKTSKDEEPTNRAVQLLTVTRLVEQKGIDILLEALSILKKRSVDYESTIVGEDELNLSYDKLRNHLGLKEDVQFTGPLPFPRVVELYSETDIFVLPCRIIKEGKREGLRDGLPNVLLEASLSELPVVSTRISGIPEGVIHDKTGLLVDSEDPEAIANALEELATHPSRRKELGENGRTYVKKKFACKKNIPSLLNIFEKTVIE